MAGKAEWSRTELYPVVRHCDIVPRLQYIANHRVIASLARKFSQVSRCRYLTRALGRNDDKSVANAIFQVGSLLIFRVINLLLARVTRRISSGIRQRYQKRTEPTRWQPKRHQNVMALLKMTMIATAIHPTPAEPNHNNETERQEGWSMCNDYIFPLPEGV